VFGRSEGPSPPPPPPSPPPTEEDFKALERVIEQNNVTTPEQVELLLSSS
jgi:hypothetical protein